jgi:hypothetical protein
MAKENDALKKFLVEQILKSMPEEVKQAGACTDPKGIEMAADLAVNVGQSIAANLMLLLVSQPGKSHEVTMRFPSLNSALGLPDEDEKAETIKDSKNAPAPTQRSAKA